VSAGTDNLPPRAAVSQMATRYWVSQAVLSLADHLASGPRTAADLAEATGAHAPSLARLLRALHTMANENFVVMDHFSTPASGPGVLKRRDA
jgi:hypothetical protein